MPFTWRQSFGLFRWKRRARKKHCVGFQVTDVPRLLRRFDEHGVRAVVLRWPQEVPRSADEESRYTKDVDILIDGAGLESGVALAAEQRGPIRCDVYSSSGKRGATYRGMPYYPPALAEQLLSDREDYESAFPIPRGALRVHSLAYHLVYHKGLQSGIPSRCGHASDPHPKRNYGERIAELARSLGVPWEAPVTLDGLYSHLKSVGWDMPFDLLGRWPRQTPWHQWLWRQEREQLRPWADALPNLLVFIVRDDIVRHGLAGPACAMLREKFDVLAIEHLSAEQVDRVSRRVRGGDWLGHQKSAILAPRMAVVCHDPRPMAESLDQAARAAGRKSGDPFPFVKNANVFHKHAVRQRLAAMAQSSRKVHGLHCGDDAFESQHMLQAIYGSDSDRMNRQFAAAVLARSIASKAA